MIIRAGIFLLLLSCIEQCSSLQLGYKRVHSSIASYQSSQFVSYSKDCKVRASGYNRCNTALKCSAFSTNHEEAVTAKKEPGINSKIATVSEAIVVSLMYIL
jgi:hypothetical protein